MSVSLSPVVRSQNMPQDILKNSWYYDAYYGKGCLRADGQCVDSSNHFYAVTMNGLDGMLK